MLARSAAYDRALINGGKPVVRADLLRGFAVRKSDVKVEAGEITVDIEAVHRRTFQGVITDIDGSLTPSRPPKASDLILPYGNELAIYMGFEGTELLPVGIFRITRTRRVGNSYEISGTDRSIYPSKALFETPYAIRTGWLLIEALQVVIGDRFPGLTFDVQTTSTAATESRPDVEIFDEEGNVVATHGDPTPILVYEAGDDPWAQATRLASRFNLEVFIDASGVCVIRDAPRSIGWTDPPTWIYEVNEDSILLDEAEEWSSEDHTNIAYALSEGAGVEEPLRATASITDPGHVLYPSAEFGRRPAFARGTYKDQARTQVIADSTVQAGSANIELLGFAAIAHPAHEAGDVVRVVVPETGLSHLCLLSSWNLDIMSANPSAFATVTSRPAELEEPPEPEA